MSNKPTTIYASRFTHSELQDLVSREEPAIKLQSRFHQYLAERFEYKRLWVNRSGCTLNAHMAKFDLYLRVLGHKSPSWPERILVIARIGFTSTKKGHGTSLLQFLVDKADEIGYSVIAIECANSDAEAFGLKFGFEKYFDNNFIANVATVREHLPARLTANTAMS